jgi:hypothetical protein
MTKKMTERRLSNLENKVFGKRSNTRELQQLIEFLYQIQPDGACWDVEAEAELMISNGFTFKKLMDNVGKNIDRTALPNQQPMLETPMEPPSKW